MCFRVHLRQRHMFFDTGERKCGREASVRRTGETDDTAGKGVGRMARREWTRLEVRAAAIREWNGERGASARPIPPPRSLS